MILWHGFQSSRHTPCAVLQTTAHGVCLLLCSRLTTAPGSGTITSRPRPASLPPPRRPCPMRPALALGLALSTALPSSAADPPARADVTRDAFALLQRACFECH